MVTAEPVATARRRGARSQAERSAETRSRVVDAAVQSIAELGVAKTTMQAIVERAGVTWGAIQHQFGSKGSIIEAVLDRAVEETLSALGDGPANDATLEERVHAFTTRAWAIWDRPLFQIAFEIITILRDDNELGIETPRYRALLMGASERIWDSAFGDLDVPPRRSATAKRIAYATLSGFALERMLSPSATSFGPALAALDRSLETLLGEST